MRRNLHNLTNLLDTNLCRDLTHTHTHTHTHNYISTLRAYAPTSASTAGKQVQVFRACVRNRNIEITTALSIVSAGCFYFANENIKRGK